MPLTHAASFIAAILQDVSESFLIELQSACIFGKEHPGNADARGIAAREERGTRWGANRICRTKIGEVDTLGRQPIQVGSMDFRSITFQIAVTEIVAKYEDDVGRTGRGSAGGRTERVFARKGRSAETLKGAPSTKEG
jgi:hypothetical protein